MTKYLFGCRLSEQKDWADKYPFRLLGITPPKEDEVDLKFPYQLANKMKQVRSSCAAHALGWVTMINNMPRPIREQNPKSYLFDNEWMYDEARLGDGYPDNDDIDDPRCDLGTAIWSAMNVLMKKGHRQILRDKSLKPNIKWGIDGYYWCQTITEMETAISLGRPIEFGLAIPEALIQWEVINDEYWIGEKKPWGNIVGSHAMCCNRYSRSRQAFQLIHTWYDFPLRTWISYKTVEALMKLAGEACVGIDKSAMG